MQAMARSPTELATGMPHTQTSGLRLVQAVVQDTVLACPIHRALCLLHFVHNATEDTFRLKSKPLQRFEIVLVLIPSQVCSR